VLATVVSASQRGQVTVDAGVKSLAFNGPPPDILLGTPAGSQYHFAGDEHGVVAFPEGAGQLTPGSRVLIAATHCDPTVNLHAEYIFVSRDGAIKPIRIEGRYESSINDAFFS
jgi:D-serine deaminase-like pyridoxal phosphate-dependent protein